MDPSLRAARGLYDPRFEHDACGIGFVARQTGGPTHEILTQALTAVGNMAHRGGVNADGRSGDGAGVLTQIPRAFFARELARREITYPVADLAVGMIFLPQDAAQQDQARRAIERGLAQHDLRLLGWRAVPVEAGALGAQARADRPVIEQALVGRRPGGRGSAAGYERTLYLARKTIEAHARAQQITGFAIPSLSSRTVVYKGLLVAPLLPRFYPDLRDPLFATAFAIFHQRYSTNTAPTWERTQPFHLLSHNGEINTLNGNVTWMRAREAAWRQAAAGNWEDAERDVPPGPALAARLAHFGPIVDTTGSDSAMLDNVLELLVRGGRDIRHALAMLVPEAWERVPDIPPAWRAFYQYHAGLMEPWDGPAALAFSDGEVVGLALDRNGLRPARYLLTDDGLVVCGSEVGAVPVDEARIVRKGKLGPGQMIAVDLRTGEFAENTRIKDDLAARQPYATWVAAQRRTLPAVPGASTEAEDAPSSPAAPLPVLQRAFGYTSEELTVILKPMGADGQEPVGSMGDDTPVAVFSDHPRLLYNYFKQRFAEVTNPPIDPLREALVMSLAIALGPRGELLDEAPGHAHLLWLDGPVLTDAQLAALRRHPDAAFACTTLAATFPVAEGPDGLVAALDRLTDQAAAAVAAGHTILVLSDRGLDAHQAPIPMLLALGAIHQHLIGRGERSRVSLVVESGEPREVHHLACLIGMGAEAVNPYLALASARSLAVERAEVQRKGAAPAEATDAHSLALAAETQYVHALEKGLLKIMSKMGIATLDSYCGAQVFEALGLDEAVVQHCFAGIPSRLSGTGFVRLAVQTLDHHAAAFAAATPTLPHPGFYKYKKEGEQHTFSPAVVHALQRAVSDDGDYAAYQAYSRLVHSRPPTELRDLLEFAPRPPVPMNEVEPVEAIVRRFSTAAMSHGSLSSEAHSTLAVAMNRLGALSNSGEGGEDPARFGDERNSPIKQVASARFGVTPAYLAAAQELQIKMAQGSKPGEGGQLPAHKVTAEIARLRHATPGVALISPPPHHDIYSIEDLAQLIYDLKQANPRAAVSVKLVAEAGVGTVAAGVVKGGADVVLISGHAGGTGASPLSSIKNAGVPWELGLAETQQTLVLNGLRGRVRLRADGGLKTGRDVLLAALLGADEFSFGTAVVVAEGCLMARTCHSNNCPVGIATQRPELRAKFAGTPEQVMHFFLHLAEEVREGLAALGARSLDAVIGRTDLLRQGPGAPAHDGDPLDLASLLQRVDPPGAAIRFVGAGRGMTPVNDLNAHLLEQAGPALDRGQPVALECPITNRDRTVGATLSGVIAARHGEAGLPEGTIQVRFTGSAGQSFGAFLAPGLRLVLEGEANDYVGKGMAGGEIVVQPPRVAPYPAHANTILGNTVLYGATGGALYAAGQAGERFAVRNSGARAVIEGVGDHGCEYMTGGVVLVLGPTGRNFAASMTGGLAYVYDEEGRFPPRCNQELVTLDRLTAADEAQVIALLTAHQARTASARAADLLARWEEAKGRLWRVQPRPL